MPKLLDPLTVGGLSMKNRIVMPPMANDLATTKGEVTQPLTAHYTRRAAGVGLVIVEHSYIAKDGKLSSRQLGIYDDTLIKGLADLAESIHAKGTPVCIQITHAGRRANSSICGSQPVAPSAIPASDSDEVPRELEKHEIQSLVRLFGEAARRACKAGFDGVEVHGAHGFLLNQFTSPLSNRRTDEFGGSFENRFRFPLEVIEEVRKAVGSDYPLLYRLGAYDGQERGVTTSECQAFARELVWAGVNMLDVSGGLIGSRPEGSTSQGYFLPLAEKIKQAVEVPVIGVGGIKDPQVADEAIRQNRVDLVAVGRAILADPDWALNAAKALSRRAADRDHGDKTVTKRT
ncbi:NADH:flavin oxidoreductase [Candidatus Bathyarchaeota archaeon]|nr:NADH:flavin oxidoreductase [Candidatus Bathyarchaeota archaeon]